jgi:hypothetical protein
MEFFKKYKLGLTLLFLMSLRFFHFSETIDTPHAWRQYDTLQYIDGYHIDDNAFLSPSVCWMGGHETLILEFPLPEYMIATLYDIFGDHLWISRLFFLFFFTITLFFFYRTLQLIFSGTTPLLATLIFGLAPLSLFFSRAIHIDFFALAFSFGMLFYAMKAIRDRSFLLLVVSMLLGTIAFLVKSPYCFFLAIPILVYAISEKRFKWLLPRAIIFVIPVICLFLWNRFAHETNGKIPDWSFIPNFNNFSQMWYWYFGTLQQRLIGGNWITIFSRIHFEILGFAGLLFFGVGVLLSKKNLSYVWTLSWLLGAFIYLSIFFNLNVIHNYYQLPFVAPLAICNAIGINWIGNRLKSPLLIASICLLGFAGEQLFYAESNYYVTNDSFEKIAAVLKKNSVPEDRIVFSYGGLSPQCPLILQPAKRKGWSIPTTDLSPSLVYQLSQEAGANKLAIIYMGYFEGELQYFFEAMKNKIGIPIDEHGKVLYICDLDFEIPS